MADNKLTESESQDIVHLEGCVKAWQMERRVVVSDMRRPDLVEQRVADFNAKIDYFTKLRDDQLARVNDGPAYIADLDAKIADANRRVKRLRHKRDIERIKDLVASINEFQGEVDERILAALQAKLAEEVDDA